MAVFFYPWTYRLAVMISVVWAGVLIIQALRAKDGQRVALAGVYALLSLTVLGVAAGLQKMIDVPATAIRAPQSGTLFAAQFPVLLALFFAVILIVVRREDTDLHLFRAWIIVTLGCASLFILFVQSMMG